MVVCHSEFESSSVAEYLSTKHTNKGQDVTSSDIRRRGPRGGLKGEAGMHPGLIVILVRIGYTEPQPEMLQALLGAMRLESFAGVLGGRPGRAHYFVGTTDKAFFYLDPHCVKDCTEGDQFFSEQIFSMAHTKADTSMGLCFFVKDY